MCDPGAFQTAASMPGLRASAALVSCSPLALPGVSPAGFQMGAPLPGACSSGWGLDPWSSGGDLCCCDIPPTYWSSHGECGAGWVLTRLSPCPFYPSLPVQ